MVNKKIKFSNDFDKEDFFDDCEVCKYIKDSTSKEKTTSTVELKNAFKRQNLKNLLVKTPDKLSD